MANAHTPVYNLHFVKIFNFWVIILLKANCSNRTFDSKLKRPHPESNGDTSKGLDLVNRANEARIESYEVTYFSSPVQYHYAMWAFEHCIFETFLMLLYAMWATIILRKIAF